MATLARVTICQDCGYHHHLQAQPILACPQCQGTHLESISQLDLDRVLASLPEPGAIRQELIN